MATPAELSDFLKSVEKRAFKRTTYHVRNDELSLDIIQDGMMKLAEHYGHKPAGELPMLFHRILFNSTMDWFRRQKVKNALFSSFSDFQSASEDDCEDDCFDVLEMLSTAEPAPAFENPETSSQRAQTLRVIEEELLLLPNRQREAFLLRYWEDMNVAETATAMGCSEGSVKTHCSRATHALSKALKTKDLK